MSRTKLKKPPIVLFELKYKEEEHIAILMKVFKEGEGVSAFCDEIDIGESTFYSWLNLHPKFKQAYQIALSKGKRYWEKLPFEGRPDFNHASWFLVMKNRFGYGRTRVRKSVDKTPIARMNSLWEGMEEGEFTPEEIGKIAGAAVSQSTIENKTEIPVDTTVVRKAREEVLEEVEKYNKYIENREKNPTVSAKPEFVLGVK